MSVQRPPTIVIVAHDLEGRPSNLRSWRRVRIGSVGAGISGMREGPGESALFLIAERYIDDPNALCGCQLRFDTGVLKINAVVSRNSLSSACENFDL